jgi:hypothetical protein
LFLKLEAGLFAADLRGDGFGSGGRGFAGGEGVVVGFKGRVLSRAAFEDFALRGGEELGLGCRLGGGGENGQADGFLVQRFWRNHAGVGAEKEPSGTKDQEEVDD